MKTVSTEDVIITIFILKKQGEIDFQRILSIVDPSASGYVQFDCFLDFITKSDMEKTVHSLLLLSLAG